MNFKEWMQQEIALPDMWDDSQDPSLSKPRKLGYDGDSLSTHHSFNPKTFDYDHYFSKQGQEELQTHLKSKPWFKKDDWITWDGKKERVDDVEADKVDLGEPLEYKMPFRLYWRKGDEFTTGLTELLKSIDAKFTYKSGVPTIWLHGQNDMADEFLSALESGDEGVIKRVRQAGRAAGARYINV